MKAIVLAIFLAGCSCKWSSGNPPRDLDSEINSTQEEIERINAQIEQLDKRSKEIRMMVDCINGALDSTMNDADQVLTIEECVRNARFR